MRMIQYSRFYWTAAVIAVAALLLPTKCSAFQIPTPTQSSSTSASSVLFAATSLSPDTAYPTTTSTSTTTSTKKAVELREYVHDGTWTLKYRYQPAAKGHETDPPLLLIHPVGIGMSSWFWDNFIREWKGGAIYAPDLLGCGIDNGSDAWNPEERGLFFPLSWVKGCETLMKDIILNDNNNNPLMNLFNGKQSQKVTVVTQGGLAPVGVMLASRNPDTVSQLVMTSPPTWKDMTEAVPEKELEQNYNLLKSPLLGGAAFSALESSWAIEFFSNLFLFAKKADDQWMQECLQECQYAEARPPIQAFNAGLMQHRSYAEELKSLSQPTVIVQGQGDGNRIPQRSDYATEMTDCTLVTLPEGLNVLPWECPSLFAETVQQAQKQQTK